MIVRSVLPALALIYLGLAALALVWPQALGAQSPAPFGHPLAALDSRVVVAGQPIVVRRSRSVAAGAAAQPKLARRP